MQAGEKNISETAGKYIAIDAKSGLKVSIITVTFNSAEYLHVFVLTLRGTR